MNEQFRVIEQAEFERGLATRLQLGEIAVGQTCLLRFEAPNLATQGRNDICVETEADITRVEKNQDGSAFIYYDYENPGKTGKRLNIGRHFLADAISYSTAQGRIHRLYFASQVTGDWDGALESLVDEELRVGV